MTDEKKPTQEQIEEMEKVHDEQGIPRDGQATGMVPRDWPERDSLHDISDLED